MDIITPSVLAVKPIKEIEFCGWIGQAAPGDILQYHRGHLALDVAAHGPLSERERAELSRVARRAWWALGGNVDGERLAHEFEALEHVAEPAVELVEIAFVLHERGAREIRDSRSPRRGATRDRRPSPPSA
jgi:hypothetical protein